MNKEDLRQIGEMIDARLQEHDRKLEDTINKRFQEQDCKLKERFDRIDARLDDHDRRFETIDEKFTKVDENFTRLEQKIDLQNVEMDRRFAEQNRVINGFRMELKNDISVLRTDLCERMDYKFEALDNKVDQVHHELSDRMDGLDNKVDQVHHELSDRIDGLDNKVDGLKFWIEDRYDPIMQSLKDYLPSTGKTYSDLEMRVAENTVSIKDSYITSVDHENRIRKLETSVQKQDTQKQERIV